MWLTVKFHRLTGGRAAHKLHVHVITNEPTALISHCLGAVAHCQANCTCRCIHESPIPSPYSPPPLLHVIGTMFDNLYVRMFSLSGDPALGQSTELRAAASDAMKAKGLFPELHRVTLFTWSRDLEMVLEMKKSGMAAPYLHRQLNRVASLEEATLQKKIHEDLKETTAVSGKIVLVGALRCRLGIAYPSTTNEQHDPVVQYGDVRPRVRVREAGVRLRCVGNVRH